MKNLIVVLVLFSGFFSFAQDNFLNFGIKAGINYGDNGEIEISDVTNSGENIIKQNADNRTGYHAGIFLRANITDYFYLKPELQYTKNSSSFMIDNEEVDYEVKKIDLPILAGIEVIGPLRVFAGPSLQYILDNDLADVRLNDVKNNFTVGLQFGLGLQWKRWYADVRYERGFSDNESESINETLGRSIRVDSRPNQFMFSVALDL
ncbi:PorT family protein [Aquimarina sp. ERC-38]|uniref:porin family protein n=1 Tax=Aquimarina sp. ERC-38 TaxID=2949996 RepID=UPI0022457D64|nr:porin family protein [Aquimarina sp. ERC-38]UZO80884.1 PorT family protein [Aquimarina sp. ERC-38]